MYRESAPPAGDCPTCRRNLVRVQHAGHRFERCPRCNGIWLDEPTLNAMWREMTGDGTPPALDAREPEDAPRPCPRCGDPMAPVALHSVPLDRCPLDGLWFDWPELQVTLASAALPEDDWRVRFAERLQRMR